MDKREISANFRKRLRHVADAPGGVGALARDTGIDRSAISQFLDPARDRLPRAETLRQIAEARGVTVDWLLSLSNAPSGQQEVRPSVQIESASYTSGGSPLDHWRREAAGMKLRYVPSSLPDMLHLRSDADVAPPDQRGAQAENVLEGFQVGDMDVEIAMPVQTVEDLADGSGLWRGTPVRQRCRQLEHMARICEDAYPMVRLHLFDGRQSFAAPFTVFGRIRAALFLGEAYLVVTSAEQVAALIRLFDGLVRNAIIGSDRVHEVLARHAAQAASPSRSNDAAPKPD